MGYMSTQQRLPNRRASETFGALVRVERERGDFGWYVIAGSYGWLHGTRDAALADARAIARGFGVMPSLDGGRA
jgi:hypothetical protein